MINKDFDVLLNDDKSIDLVKRKIKKKKSQIYLYYLTSLIDNLQFNEMFQTLVNTSSKDSFFNELTIPNVLILKDIKEALYFLYSGAVIVFYDEEIICVDIRLYQTRAIQEPEAEKSIRGNKDGFVESLIINISLLRRRIKDFGFNIEHFIVSKDSKMSISLCYLKNKVNHKVLKKIKEKIDTLNIDSLIMSDRALEELIFKQSKTIFPLVRYSERPDVASISIIKGKIVILVDNSSSCIIFPTNLFDHFCNVEEYREPPINGTLTRFIRSLSIFVSVLLLPTFICLSFNQTINNNIIVLNNLTLSKPILIFQIIASVFIMEVFRIASIHTPNSLVSAVSFFAAIILGEISMNLGIFLPEILLVVSISLICGFATPSYELSLCNRIIMIVLTLLSIFFNYIGLMIGIIIIFIHLLSINTFSYPYLYPLVPFDFDKFKDVFRRKNADKKKDC